MSEIVDHDHDAMEQRLSHGRKHDMGKHGFFDRVEDFTEHVDSAFDDNVHEDAKDFSEADVLVRQRPSKVMNVSQASVGTTPSNITPGIDGQTSVTVQNIGTTDCYVGPTSPTSQSWQGFKVPAGGTFTVDYTGALWASTSAGSTTVCVMALAYGSL